MPTRSSSRFSFAALIVGVAALAGSALGQPLNEDLKLIPADNLAGDNFGYSIDIDNGIIVSGARYDDTGTTSGSAYLYDAATGAELFKLVPSDGAAGDEFGFSVAIDSGVVAVGAYKDDDAGSNSGSVYLFNATTGVQYAKLTASDAAQTDWFGYSVAIHGGIVAVGAVSDTNAGGGFAGSAYLFDATTGAQLHHLFAGDPDVSDQFGVRVAIDSGVVAVGAYQDDDLGSKSGSVYLFDAATGTQYAKVLPLDGAAGDEFGRQLSISSGILAAGVQLDDDLGDRSGSAYLFDVTTGDQIAKLLPDDGEALDRFGSDVSISDGVVAVGSYQDDDNGAGSGSAYLFDAATGAQTAKLLSSDGLLADRFGWSIAIQSGTVAVGVPSRYDNGNTSGAAYVFSLPGPDCVADLSGDGILDNGDIGVFVGLFLAGDLSADMSGDGILDNGDIGVFVALFLAGC
ncbi:MAG: hypothetical protein ACI89L_001305 [Phycisphaerales bacterium]|jgi:hypothetical protein